MLELELEALAEALTLTEEDALLVEETEGHEAEALVEPLLETVLVELELPETVDEVLPVLELELEALAEALTL